MAANRQTYIHMHVRKLCGVIIVSPYWFSQSSSALEKQFDDWQMVSQSTDMVVGSHQ